MSPGENAQEGTPEIQPLEMIASFAKLIDPPQAYQEVLRLVTRWFDADCGQIITTDPETGQTSVRAVSLGLQDSDLTFSTTILKDALGGNKAVCIADAKQHPHYRDAESVVGKRGAFLSVIVVPLRNQEGQALGALYLQRWSGQDGFYDGKIDTARLVGLMDTLAPILFEQEQQTSFQSLRLGQTKAAIAEMGFTVGRSRIMDDQVYDRIEKYARSNLTVCIHGETGCGKEWVAEAIHHLGHRAQKPFVRVPCNAIPEGLAESEFFGHVKGAFAQAYGAKRGQFEVAAEGTIFLDEISTLSRELQGKLLHVLEKGRSQEIRFYPVGSVKEIAVDVRVIASSNQDLQLLVARGLFREDLFHRVNQLPLHVPPLRKRREDIAVLAQGFLEEASREQSRALYLSAEAQESLADYDWPGNVRELKSCIHRTALLHEGSQPIRVDEIRQAMRGTAEAARATDDGLLGGTSFLQLRKPERHRVVLAAMKKYGSARKAAKALGVSHQTIYNYLNDAEA